MSSLFDQFATNPEKEINGAEVTFPPNKDGSIPTFILAATSRSNVKYAKALDTAVKPWRRNMDAMSNQQAESIYSTVFVENVLKGWRHVQDENGTEIPFTKENAKELFKKLPRLYDELNSRAASVELFKDAAREEEAKN